MAKKICGVPQGSQFDSMFVSFHCDNVMLPAFVISNTNYLRNTIIEKKIYFKKLTRELFYYAKETKPEIRAKERPEKCLHSSSAFQSVLHLHLDSFFSCISIPSSQSWSMVLRTLKDRDATKKFNYRPWPANNNNQRPNRVS